MRWMIPSVGALSLALSGCVSLGDLDQKAPAYSADLPGNYLAAAECTKARQAKATTIVRIDLLHDAAKKEAMVTWNHDLGTGTAFVFTGTNSGTTHLRVYESTPVDQKWIAIAEGCGSNS
ncbi:hypothetical protein [Cupriavidus campinensis]|uniref:Lipoprotein n=1 Tax=Cupriavidus campinensis TaxID=151783 RepID=A0AAE9L1J2_9BURK|nr:hypothetical protein [Cupriavidus campinensis]URF03000.1 hypothetical protein M5D45_10575 [Cupriavidus campinensis]